MEAQNGLNNEKLLLEILRHADDKDKQIIDKLSMHLEVLNRWIFIKNLGLNLKSYFIRNGYNKVAIYGMGDLGCRLLEELERTEIKVIYGIDKSPLAIDVRSKLRIIHPENFWEQDIDAVIVTPVFYYEELKKMIHNKVNCPVISLKEIIWQV